MAKKIRYRDRLNSSPKEGQRQTWGEYQVVDGRKIVGRYDTLDQAKKDHPDVTHITWVATDAAKAIGTTDMNTQGTIDIYFYAPMIIDADFTGAEIEGNAVVAYTLDRGEISWRVERLTTDIAKRNPDPDGPMFIYRTVEIDQSYHRDIYFRVLAHLERKAEEIKSDIEAELENEGIVIPNPYDEHRTYTA